MARKNIFKKSLLLLCLLLMPSISFGENFSEMSTQELIQIMGYVKKENKYKFEKELKSRISTMTSQEKKEYKKNLDKLKKN